MSESIVGIIGLGYVGLPLAVAFGRTRKVIGYDENLLRVAALREGRDDTGEVDRETLHSATGLQLTADPSLLAAAVTFIVAVPTPVDEAHQPDFGPLLAACHAVGPHLRAGATVVFESTVYPGATEEVCIPALESASGLRWKRDFSVGYSPERINPGDKERTLEKIVKVVAGDTPETLDRLSSLYASVAKAGVHRASSIKVAEAAKVIENTQRDINIALMNELAIICHRVGIDTRDVLRAAATKWNFLDFRPGLVGGHCIGVDPYYLTHKAEMLGLRPQVILAGRRINDGMAKFVAEHTVKCLVASGRSVNGSRVSVLGLTFKENCPDLRNSKVADLVRELESFGIVIAVHDPRASPGEAMREYGIELMPWQSLGDADAVVLAVPHREYLDRPSHEIAGLAAPGGCVVDVKSALDLDLLEARGLRVWRL
ncbi:MAG: nucleotide sugar dehydrogenase [Betaproteobacteria bacterium]|nr:nucleotide sugar dehydrogenase [Betaproteobacteria bacterium]